MSRNRVIYNVQDVLVGPSEANTNRLFHNAHILQRFDRVFSFDYDFNIPKSAIQTLGKQGTIAEVNQNGLEVNFEVSYYIYGVANEVRAGMNPLYNISGINVVNEHPVYIFSNLISGFYNPYFDDDNRNYYLVLNTGQDDIRVNENVNFSDSNTSFENFINNYTTGSNVVCFVNSVMNSYRVNASVGNFPVGTMSFEAENLIVYSSGSGVPVPTLRSNEPATKNSSDRFVIPKYSGNFDSNITTVVKPGDITVDLSQAGNSVVDISDVKVQSFDIQVNIPREPISFLGHYRPIKKQIIPPISVQLNMNMIVGELASSEILYYLDDNLKHDLNISFKDSKINGNFNNVVNFNFKNVELKNASFNNSIGSNKSIDILFTTEIVPSGFATGMFISGNIPHNENSELPIFSTVLALEDGQSLTTETDDEIFIEDTVITPDKF